MKWNVFKAALRKIKNGFWMMLNPTLAHRLGLDK